MNSSNETENLEQGEPILAFLCHLTDRDKASKIRDALAEEIKEISDIPIQPTPGQLKNHISAITHNNRVVMTINAKTGVMTYG